MDMDKDKANTLLEREETGKYENVVNTTENHQKLSNGQKLCQCMDCGKSFTRKSSLIVHQRIHTGEKRFICSECGKRFGLKSSMVRHMRTHTPKTLKICPDCGKCFSRHSSLFQHQKVHQKERLYRCTYCEKSFTRASQLLAHQRIHKQRPLPDGGDCEEGLYDQDKLQKNVPCLECGKSFKEHRSLMRHQRIHKESTATFSCNRNDGTAHDMPFSEDSIVSQSLQIVNSLEQIKDRTFYAEKKVNEVEKRFLCIDCGKSFTRKSSLIVHQRIHTGEKMFMCSECGKKFGLKSSMVRHMRTHSSTKLQQRKIHRMEKPYKSPQCEKSVCRASQLIVHERNHKAGVPFPKSEPAGQDFLNGECDQFTGTNVEESYRCPECGKCFRRQTSFIRHQRIHKGNSFLYNTSNGTNGITNKDDVETAKQEPPTITEKCSPGLDKNSYIVIKFGDNTDSKTSRGAKSILCIDCGKCFTRKSSLIVHQRVHTGEKLFMCTDCGKRFSLKSSLVRHMRTHSPKILNICSDCGRCFSRYSSLFQHQKVHRREKPYKCLLCEKSFSRASQLLFHQRMHKVENFCPKSEAGDDNEVQGKVNCTEELHACLECGEQFKEEHLLNQHQKTHIDESSNYMKHNRNSNTPHLGAESNCRPSEIIVESQDLICKVDSNNMESEKLVKREFDNSSCKTRLSTGRRAYHCIQCGKNFTRKSSLIVHQGIHTGEKMFMCKECGKRFGFKSSLVRHLKTHAGHMLNVCSECGIYFSRYCDLLLHLENHMDGEPTRSQRNEESCTDPSFSHYCGNLLTISESSVKGCSRKTDEDRSHSEPPILDVLNNHNLEGGISDGSDKMQKRTQSSEKRFLCSDCGKHFTRKSSLIVHQRIHTGEKLFMCTECGKMFGLKSSMVRHMRIHNKEYFKCMTCGKSFRDYSKFLDHETSHSGEFPSTEPQQSVR